MVNPIVFGIIVIVTAFAYPLISTTMSSQNVIAYNPGPAVDKEASMDALKAGQAGNTTMTNQIANGNMTGTNSTG